MNIIQKYNIDVHKVLLSLKGLNNNNLFEGNKIQISKGGEQFQVVCPFHKDQTPSMGINTKYNKYNCFVCSNRTGELKNIHKNQSLGKGSFIHHFFIVFFEMIYNKKIEFNELVTICNIPPEKVVEFKKDLGNTNTFSHNQRQEYKQKIENLKNKKIKTSELDIYIKNRINENTKTNNMNYILKRLNKYNDFTNKQLVEIINHFSLGYDYKTKSITIPIIQDNYIRGIYARRIDVKEGKYINIESFDKKNIIYNYDNIEYDKPVILVEGPLNVIKLWGLGFKNVISLFSSNSYPGQIEKLIKCKKLYIWFDSDFSGKQGISFLKKTLSKRVKIFCIESEGKKDVYDYNKKETVRIIKGSSLIN